VQRQQRGRARWAAWRRQRQRLGGGRGCAAARVVRCMLKRRCNALSRCGVVTRRTRRRDARCKNTVQGRQYIADNGGRVCEWAGADAKGCCSQALEPCAGCDTARALSCAYALNAASLACRSRLTGSPAPPGLLVLRGVRVLRVLLPAQRGGHRRRVALVVPLRRAPRDGRVSRRLRLLPRQVPHQPQEHGALPRCAHRGAAPLPGTRARHRPDADKSAASCVVAAGARERICESLAPLLRRRRVRGRRHAAGAHAVACGSHRPSRRRGTPLAYLRCSSRFSARADAGRACNARACTPAQGLSCTAACAAVGKACAEAALAALNNCDRLRAAFPCEAGCSAGAGPELPAYMSGAVTDASTMCRTAEPSAPLACAAQAPNTRRLCACGPGPA
jgi:hypothetical protein